ncbi:MAG: hypothetical protein IIT45_07610, partial [Treponema sp.]|nr:hypothetical protein [Treponema sp.]
MTNAINTKGIHSLRTRISVLLVLAALMLAASISFVALGLFTVHTRSSHLKMAKGVAILAAEAIDADSIELYKQDGMAVSGYEETFRRLKSLQQQIPDIT